MLFLQLTEHKTTLLTRSIDPDDIDTVLAEFDRLQAEHKHAMFTATLEVEVDGAPADRVLGQLLQRSWKAPLQFQGITENWSLFISGFEAPAIHIATKKGTPERLTVQGGLCGQGVPSQLWGERGGALQVAHADVRRAIRMAGKS